MHRNIVKGIFNSNKGGFIQNLADIPCGTMETLESDADQAEQFVSQIQAGEIPSAITDLPEEAVSELETIIDVVTMVIEDVADAVVTDVVKVFNEIEDGSIASAIEGIPKDIIKGITKGWDDLTSEAKGVWGDVTCFFKGGCPSTSPGGSCRTPAAASASATTNAAAASASAYYASESGASEAAAATSAYYASESRASEGAAASSAYYASQSTASEAAAAAYTSSYYASESAVAAAAYTSSYYASESAVAASEYYASQSSSAVASTVDQAETVTSNPSAQTTTQTTPQGTSQPTQPSQPSSRGLASYRWAGSHALAITAMIVFGLVLRL